MWSYHWCSLIRQPCRAAPLKNHLPTAADRMVLTGYLLLFLLKTSHNLHRFPGTYGILQTVLVTPIFLQNKQFTDQPYLGDFFNLSPTWKQNLTRFCWGDSPEACSLSTGWHFPSLRPRPGFPTSKLHQLRHLSKWHPYQNTWGILLKRPFWRRTPAFSVLGPFLVPKRWSGPWNALAGGEMKHLQLLKTKR